MDFHTLKKFNKKTAGGKRLLSLLITEANRKKLNAYLKNRLKAKMRRRAFEDSAANLKDLVGSSVRHMTPITQPLMLIVDLPFCGGALLNQLFDGHPQLHVHPGEIKLEIDEHKKFNGIKPDPLNSPKQWFVRLAQSYMDMHLEEVYRNLKITDSPQPFVFIPYLQKRIFLRYLKSVKPRNLRAIYNAHMTSYFGSWLNYSNLNGYDKKFVVGLSRTDAMNPEKVKQLFEVYPDGKLVSIIRNPKNWIRTTSPHHGHNYPDAHSAIHHWRESTSAVLRNKDVFGSRVCIVRYEDLTGNTEAVMQHLSKFLNIEFDSILLTPTFNRSSVRALNDAEMIAEAHRNPLRQADTKLIKEIAVNWNKTLDEYEAVLGKAAQF